MRRDDQDSYTFGRIKSTSN